MMQTEDIGIEFNVFANHALAARPQKTTEKRNGGLCTSPSLQRLDPNPKKRRSMFRLDIPVSLVHDV